MNWTPTDGWHILDFLQKEPSLQSQKLPCDVSHSMKQKDYWEIHFKSTLLILIQMLVLGPNEELKQIFKVCEAFSKELRSFFFPPCRFDKLQQYWENTEDQHNKHIVHSPFYMVILIFKDVLICLHYAPLSYSLQKLWGQDIFRNQIKERESREVL